MSGIFLLVLALAGPLGGMKVEKVKREGIDIMIALDVSNSMLASDVEPNRLERARMAISSLIDRLKGDRIGLVIFAGNAYTQLPITTDYAAARMFLGTISTDMIQTQGTAIGAAIDKAATSFDDESKGGKAIIVITDGENHEDDAVGAASAAYARGIHTYTLGIGSPQGVPIPIHSGGQVSGYRTDKSGSTVVTRLDEQILIKVAEAGGGKYLRGNNTVSALNALYEDIEKMSRNEYEAKDIRLYENHFQIPLFLGILLLITESLLGNRRMKKRFKNIFE
jgi:Ca-activated chloride channel family protein